MEKKIRITKVMRLEDIIAMLNGKDVTYGTTVEEATSVLNHEIELLQRKNASPSSKKKEDAEQNEAYKKDILDYLSTLNDDDPGKTCGEIGKAVPSLSEFQNQKISYLVRSMKNAGILTVSTVKGRSLFKLA